MRVTHVVENLNRGGLERVVVDLIEQQRRNGHTCQVVCLFEPGKLAEEIQRLGVSLISCQKKSGLDWRAIRMMRRAIAGQNAEVVHSHNAVAHYHAVLASAFLGARRVNTRHGMGGNSLSWKREFLYRISMFFSDVAAVVCNAARENFVKHKILTNAKSITIYNGIPVDRFAVRNAKAKQKLLDETGWTDDSVVLGIVARLNPLKDHDMLLQAMAIIHAAEPAARLVLIGDGALRAELEACTAKLNLGHVVCFLGDRSDIADLLCGLDIFVLSSTTEGYSISLLEACAAALPIVATDVGGNREIVQNEHNGYLVPAKSPAQFAEATLRLIRAPQERIETGLRNRKFAEEGGSVRTMANRYDTVYQNNFDTALLTDTRRAGAV
jgi:glycosyltransferase involved in cell wall biosynthesis